MSTALLTRGLPALALLCAATPAFAQPQLTIRLPERLRVLEDQRVDVVVEVRGVTPTGPVQVVAGGNSLSSSFASSTVDLDCNTTNDTVYRADMVSFPRAGRITLTATVPTAGGMLSDSRGSPFIPSCRSGRNATSCSSSATPWAPRIATPRS